MVTFYLPLLKSQLLQGSRNLPTFRVLEEGHITGLSLLSKAEGSEALGLPVLGGTDSSCSCLPGLQPAPGQGSHRQRPGDRYLPGPNWSDQLVRLPAGPKPWRSQAVVRAGSSPLVERAALLPACRPHQHLVRCRGSARLRFPQGRPCLPSWQQGRRNRKIALCYLVFCAFCC